MEKIHTIEFTTDGDIADLKKKVSKCIDTAFAKDRIEEAECDLFITHIAELTKLSFDMDDETKSMVDDWKDAMLEKDVGTKRSFRCSYAKPFSEIGSDIIELSSDHRELNPDRKEAKD